MQLHVKYDREASSIAEKIVFSCDTFELCRDDIIELKQKKLLRFVKWDDLPEALQCQIIVQYETFKKVKVIFFNPNVQLPKEIFNEPLLNKDLIEQSQRNWFFWLEFTIPLDDKCVKLDFSYETD